MSALSALLWHRSVAARSERRLGAAAAPPPATQLAIIFAFRAPWRTGSARLGGPRQKAGMSCLRCSQAARVPSPPHSLAALVYRTTFLAACSRQRRRRFRSLRGEAANHGAGGSQERGVHPAVHRGARGVTRGRAARKDCDCRGPRFLPPFPTSLHCCMIARERTAGGLAQQRRRLSCRRRCRRRSAAPLATETSLCPPFPHSACCR